MGVATWGRCLGLALALAGSLGRPRCCADPGRSRPSGDQWLDPEPPEGEAEGGQPCPGGLSGADGA